VRIKSIALLALVSSVALVGCGGDDKGGINVSDKKTTTTEASAEDDKSSEASDEDREAVVSYIADSPNDFGDEDAGECVADAILGDISADGLATIKDGGDFDLENFSDDDGELLISGLDECVPLDDALDAFAEGIASDEQIPLSAEEARCAAEEFAQDYSGTGEFIREVSAMDDDESGMGILSALGPCMTPESAVTFMSTIMGEELGEELGQCVAQSIVDQLGVEGMLKAFADSATGSDSALTTASEAAATECAAQGLAPDAGVGGGLDG